MNVKCSIFFDIDNIHDFFYSVLLPTISTKNYIQTFECEEKPNLSEISNILDCKRVIYKNKNSYIIYEDDLIDGGWTFINSIAKKYNVKTLYLKIIDEGPYPAYYLAYFENNTERIIYNIKETRWTFFSKGPIAFFEEGEQYLEKKTSDKFNKEKIILFCKRLGVDILDEQFLKPISSVYCMKRK